MNTLGLDVSPLRIGWAIIASKEVRKHGTIVFESNEWVTPGMRSDALEDALGEEKIDRIGLEAVFVGPNRLGSIRAAMALGQVESIADYLWPDAKQKVLTAAQWRKLADVPPGGKASVMEYAEDVCDAHEVERPGMQDAADAIAIGIAADSWFDSQDDE